jgi:hypothetical protein
LPTRRINRLNVDQSNFFFIALMNWNTKPLMKVEGATNLFI